MSTERMDLLRDYHNDILTIMPFDRAQRAIDMLTMRLDAYDITKACHDLIVPETKSEMMIRNYLATKKIEGKSDLTIQRYNYEVRRMTGYLHKPIAEMDVYDLRRYLASMALRGMKMSSISSTQSVIMAFFTWVHREGFIEKNPASQLGKVKEEEVVKHAFSSTDMDRLRSACDNDRDRALVEFLRSTGCRISEVVGLNRNDIDYTNKQCVVLGKGNKNRTVYLDDVCIMHLKSYLDHRTDQSQALFGGRATTRMTAHGVRQMLVRLGEKAHVENVHPHRFRRTLATNLAKRGMPVQDIARILGHANLDTTMIYVNMDDVGTKAAYNRYTA